MEHRVRAGVQVVVRVGILLLCLSAPGLAAAQSFHVSNAVLRSEGHSVGELFGAPVDISGWTSDTRPTIAYADRVVTMTATIDLADENTFLSAGVGRARPVQTTSAFRIDMNANVWAPVWGRAQDGVRIALPPGFPAREAVLPTSPRMSATADPPHDAFSYAGTPRTFDLVCGQLRIRAEPRADAELWLAAGDGAALHVGVERDGFTRVRLFRDGFVVHGWLEGGPPSCQDLNMGLSGVGSGCGDGRGRGIIVNLPAGTELYGSRTAAQPFGRLRADTPGLEPVDGDVAQACTNGVCRRVPPEPTGTARWIMHSHRPRSGGWILNAWVRTPAEQLARPRGASSGFGGCRNTPTDWPRP